MFTNPLNRKYQTGGSMDAKMASKFVNWLMTSKKSPYKGKSREELASIIRDERNKEKLAKLFETFKTDSQNDTKETSQQESKLFAKNGGKMQQFICKHGRGGNVDCGCNGGKVIRGEDGMQTPQNRYSGWQKQARRWVTLPDGSTQAIEVIVSPDGQTGIQRIITDRSQMQNRGGMAVRDTVYGGGAYDNGRVLIDASQPMIPQEIDDLNAYLDNKTPSKEDGGVVMGKDGLSRRQVRQDKRAVKAMLRPTGQYTSEDRYQYALNQAKRATQYQGMSRLERKNALNQYLLGRNKPVVQTPIQPDLGENYVINETTVPYQFFNPTPQVVETPEVAVVTQPQSTPVTNTTPTPAAPINYDSMKFNDAFAAARKAGVNTFNWRGKSYAVKLDPNWKSKWKSNQNNNNNSEEISSNTDDGFYKYGNKELKYIGGRHVEDRSGEGYWAGNIVRDSNGNWIELNANDSNSFDNVYNINGYPLGSEPAHEILEERKRNIDWSKQSTWDPYIRMNNGPLSTYQMNLIRTLYENPNATIDDMAGGRRTWTQEAFDLNKRKFGFKQGGKIEKHQDANGKIATSNVTPVGKVTQIRFPKILFGPGHNTVSFKSDDGLVHTWTRYDDGIYAYNSSPSYITKIYSPKAKETKNVRDGLKHTTITYPIDSTLTQKVDALIDDNTKWWK